MSLEFDESYSTDSLPCIVSFKGCLVFNIRYDKSTKKYWICDSGGFIDFRYYAGNPDNDLDFIKPYKYADTLYDAKKNCKHIMYTYINWLTEK